jgi:raffinose/stachyose/melibiose transport system permease protein
LNFIWTAIFLIIPMCLALVMAAALMMAPSSRIVVQSIIFLPRILAAAVTRRIFEA